MIPANIARLNSNGGTDATFIPYLNNNVQTTGLLNDGSVVIGGLFTEVNGSTRNRLCVLNNEGSPITGNLDVGSNVNAVATQSNGAVLFGGLFDDVGIEPRFKIARLSPALSLDPSFISDRPSNVLTLSQVEDGKLWAGMIESATRILNNEAQSNITVQSDSQVLWEVSGSYPQAFAAKLYSKEVGDPDWTFEANGTPVQGGWLFTGLTLGEEGELKIESFIQGGASQSFQTDLGTYLFKPLMQVLDANNQPLASGAPVNYGSVQNGSTISRTFTILNNGLADLTIDLPTVLSGTNADQYSIDQQPDETVPPGQQTTFILSFKPTTVAENKVATFTLDSDDSSTPTFTLSLTGTSLAGPGSRDNTFQPVANGTIYSASINEIGSILVGGLFTSLNSVTRNRSGKLLSTGSNDPLFSGSGIGSNQGVYCTACDIDGNNYIGGYFTSYNGSTKRRLVKITPTGAVDTSFNPNINNTVYSICIQADGKILVAGVFDTINGTTTGGLARLNTNGTLDVTFSNPISSTFSHKSVLQLPSGRIVSAYSGSIVAMLPSGVVDTTFGSSGYVTGNGSVESLIVDYLNRIYVGGTFTTFAATTRNGLARLNANGTLDGTFANASYGIVSTCIPQTDGKVIVGGAGGSISRRNEDGTNDTSFADTLSGGIVSGIVLQRDGKPIVVGQFTIDSISNVRIARLQNDTLPGNAAEPNVTESLSVQANGDIQWLRGGVSPEANIVTFAVSQDNGATWTSLGSASRITGGWILSGANVPASGKMRGYARCRGGRYNGSSSLIQTTVDFSGVNAPDITVQQPANNFLNPTGSTVQFTGVSVGQFSTLNFLITNPGSLAISSLFANVTSTDFSIISSPPVSIPPGGQANLQVRFSPTSIGVRNANLLITSNVPGVKSQFTIVLQGNGIAIPVATTQTPQSVTATTALMRAMVTARDDSAAVSFRYRQGSAGSWINVTSLPASVSGFTATSVTGSLTGLTASTTYQYQVVVTNTLRPPSNPVYGATITFTTPA